VNVRLPATPGGARAATRPATASRADRAPGDDGTWWDRWWFAVCTTALIVASDYKFRTRDPSQSLSAAIDSAIILELAVYAFVGLAVVRRHGRPPRLGRVPTSVFLASFFTGLMVLSVTYATYPNYAFVRSGQMLVLTSLMLLAASTVTREHFHRFLHAYLVVITLSIVYGRVRPSTPLNNLQVGRFTWLAIHPTVAGVFTGLAFVIAASYSTWGARPRPEPRWPLPFYLLAAIMSGGAMLLVHTRGAVLGAIVGYGLSLLLLADRRRRVQLVVAGAFGLVATLLTASSTIVAYFTRGDSPEQIASLNTRTDLWAVALDAIESQPMFGYGLGSTRGIFYAETGLGGGHNAAVNVATDLGLVGLACWTALVASVLVAAARSTRDGHGELGVDRALIIGIVGFLLLDGMFYEGLGGPTNVAITTFYACVAWVATLQRIRTSPGRPDPGV
jgi:exopolysaccharide production protein ExoQ